jgi:hypothetical protein
MIKHPKKINGFDGSLEDLAKSIGNLTYDQTAIFLEKLADNIKMQAENDLARGRVKLAKKLNDTAEKLYQARDNMELTWKICKPYMEKK